MSTKTLQRLIFWVIPALLLVAVVLATVWGDHGVLTRDRYQQELRQEQAALAALERENQRLSREISLMDRDPRVLRRVVADELHWAKDGAVIYDFSDEEAPAQAP
ncbi:MAG: septum formation initiator family protein [Deltaproteobacteria bacterium]|nr:septum formation initiator family protein [Deltaproteobacteria bacterium]